MKKSTLLLVLMSFFILPAFSQQENFTDQISGNWNYSKQIDSNLITNFDFNLLRDSMHTFLKGDHYYPFPEFAEKGIMDDHMTILKPRGNFPALVVKPDTTIRYSLLIRKP